MFKRTKFHKLEKKMDLEITLFPWNERQLGIGNMHTPVLRVLPNKNDMKSYGMTPW